MRLGWKAAGWLAIVLALGHLDGTSAVAAESGARGRTVVVRPGDTLSGIAARHKVTIEQLEAWNAGKIGKNGLIKAGDRLVVRHKQPAVIPGGGPDEAKSATVRAAAEEPEWEGFYDIRPGDTLGRIAKRLGVTVAELEAWNGLRPGQPIKAGANLRYVRPGKRPPARSQGRPTAGRLMHGVHLGTGAGYRLRFPNNAFVIPRVRKTLRACAAQVKKRFPGTADILIGDISRPTGGHFPPHQSHQTGRDVDAGYYLTGNVQNVTMHRVWPHDLDYAKNWALLKCWLSRDRVVRVYMDTGIQKAMAEYVRKRKLASDETIDRLFEAVSRAPKRALVKHAPNHDTHVHVRFACDPEDSECHEEETDSVWTF